jgi:hypothetical protein
VGGMGAQSELGAQSFIEIKSSSEMPF